MLPTINVQKVWIGIDNRFSRGRGVKVGDVVDFHNPMARGHGAVKRVMGMPGDFVVKDGGEGRGKMMIQVRCLGPKGLTVVSAGWVGKMLIGGWSIGARWSLLGVGG